MTHRVDASPEEKLADALDRLSNVFEQFLNLFFGIVDNFRTYSVIAIIAFFVAAVVAGMLLGTLIVR